LPLISNHGYDSSGYIWYDKISSMAQVTLIVINKSCKRTLLWNFVGIKSYISLVVLSNFLFWKEPLVLVFHFEKVDRTPNTILKIFFGNYKYFGLRDFPKNWSLLQFKIVFSSICIAPKSKLIISLYGIHTHGGGCYWEQTQLGKITNDIRELIVKRPNSKYF
jgi:hypothetical protein